jgi:thiol:disulfide interchange protein DsbC
MHKSKMILLPLLFSTALSANSLTQEERETMINNINQKALFTVKNLEESSVENMYLLDTSKGLFYATKDGKHLFAGNLFSLDGGVVNLTAKYKTKQAQSKFSEYKDTMITYKAKEEKHSVYVFTDITCGYCKKLHDQIDDYNDLGITVNYIAYPRNGLGRNGEGTSTSKKMDTIWCEDDKKVALDTAIKAPYTVPTNTQCTSPVEAHYNLGQALGVGGTPAIYASTGKKISAYLSPEKLLAEIVKVVK